MSELTHDPQQDYIVSLERTIEQQARDVLMARSETEAIRLRYEAERESVQGCTAKVVALKSQLAAITRERDQDEQQLALMQTTIDQLNAVIVMQAKRIDELRDMLTARGERIRQLEEREAW